MKKIINSFLLLSIIGYTHTKNLSFEQEWKNFEEQIHTFHKQMGNAINQMFDQFNAQLSHSPDELPTELSESLDIAQKENNITINIPLPASLLDKENTIPQVSKNNLAIQTPSLDFICSYNKKNCWLSLYLECKKEITYENNQENKTSSSSNYQQINTHGFYVKNAPSFEEATVHYDNQKELLTVELPLIATEPTKKIAINFVN